MPELDAFVLESCTIDLRRPQALIAFDGETEAMPTPLEYRIEHDTLRIVVPEAVEEAAEEAAAAKSA